MEIHSGLSCPEDDKPWRIGLEVYSAVEASQGIFSICEKSRSRTFPTTQFPRTASNNGTTYTGSDDEQFMEVMDD